MSTKGQEKTLQGPQMASASASAASVSGQIAKNWLITARAPGLPFGISAAC